MAPEIILEPWQIREAHRLAARIDANKKKRGVRDRRVDQSRTDLQILTLGILGEMAVAKYFDQEIEWDLYTGGDPGWDLSVGGYRIQVKTAWSDKADFHLESYQDFKADYGILVIPHEWAPDALVLAGYLTRITFINNFELTPIKYDDKPAKVVDRNLLKPVEELKETIGGSLEL